MGRFRTRIFAYVALALSASAAAAQGPRMTAEQAKRLYAAAGFPISPDGKSPTNRCGKTASPRILFVDMNGDKRNEAYFIDTGACYQPDGKWFAIVTPEPDGSWRRIIDGPGSIQPEKRAEDWLVLTVTSGGKKQVYSFDGRAYAPISASGGAKPSAPKPATPTAAQTPASRDAAIFRAAGLRQIRGRWESGCNDPTTGAAYDPGRIDQVKDLNGDGRPEAVVVEGGSYCYGMTGEHFWLVSQQADGGWKLIYDETGIAEFLPTKGVGGWPDISVGGPGFCFPVMRWTGQAYVRNRFAYEGKPCRPPVP